MSSNLPLRTVRIPALRQQCLFQHRRCLQSPRAFSTTAPQAFSSTNPRFRSSSSIGGDRSVSKAAMKHQMGIAPRTQQKKSQEEGAMAEDIGLLQDTVIRASLGKLPSIISPRFWGYMWKLLKTKGTAFYSRIQYNRCLPGVTGWERWKRVDRWKGGQIKVQAKTLYKQLYINFVNGDMTPISKHCLPPVLKEFKDRIAARGEGVKMDWKLVKQPSAQIVSHRASLMGQDPSEGGFRQVVVRITSTQELTTSWRGGNLGGKRAFTGKSTSGWSPRGMAVEPSVQPDVVDDASFEIPKSSKMRKKVVEYMVLQKRVIQGKQDEHWKIWGFVQESTPESIAEDDEYWRQTMSSQTATA